MPSDARNIETHTQYTTEAAVVHCADFSNFPEVLAGQTLVSGNMTAVAGVTFAGTAVTDATFTNTLPNGSSDTVPAGQGVKTAITCTTRGKYTISFNAVLSGGATVSTKMELDVR